MSSSYRENINDIIINNIYIFILSAAMSKAEEAKWVLGGNTAPPPPLKNSVVTFTYSMGVTQRF